MSVLDKTRSLPRADFSKKKSDGKETVSSNKMLAVKASKAPLKEEVLREIADSPSKEKQQEIMKDGMASVVSNIIDVMTTTPGPSELNLHDLTITFDYQKSVEVLSQVDLHPGVTASIEAIKAEMQKKKSSTEKLRQQIGERQEATKGTKRKEAYSLEQTA